MDLNISIKEVFENNGVVLDFVSAFEDFGPSGRRYDVFKFNCKGGCELFVWVGEPGCGGMIKISKSQKYSIQNFMVGDVSYEESLSAFLSNNRVYIDMLNGVREVEDFIDWMGQK